jgi:hypothetical protein
MSAEPFTDADPATGTWGGVDFAAVKTLITHQRLDIGSCGCGWGVNTGDLGRLHSLHVWRELQRAVLPAHDARIRARAGEDAAQALTEQARRERDGTVDQVVLLHAAEIVREATGATEGGDHA